MLGTSWPRERVAKLKVAWPLSRPAYVMHSLWNELKVSVWLWPGTILPDHNLGDNWTSGHSKVEKFSVDLHWVHWVCGPGGERGLSHWVTRQSSGFGGSAGVEIAQEDMELAVTYRDAGQSDIQCSELHHPLELYPPRRLLDHLQSPGL